MGKLKNVVFPFEVDTVVYGISVTISDITDTKDIVIPANSFVMDYQEPINQKQLMEFYISEWVVKKYSKDASGYYLNLLPLSEKKIELFNKNNIKILLVSLSDIPVCVFETMDKAKARLKRYCELTHELINTDNILKRKRKNKYIL